MWVVLLILMAGLVFAGQRAITDNGDYVILNDDGTWAYEEKAISAEPKILANTGSFKKHPDAQFVLKSERNDSTFAVDPEAWHFAKSEGGDAYAEFEFQLKGQDLYGMAITERIEIEKHELAKIAFENAQAAGTNSSVIKKEYRKVNNTPVIYMEMLATLHGIEFKYHGYYYSNATGSTQLVVYTAVNLADKYAAEINKILNGFAVQP